MVPSPSRMAVAAVRYPWRGRRLRGEHAARGEAARRKRQASVFLQRGGANRVWPAPADHVPGPQLDGGSAVAHPRKPGSQAIEALAAQEWQHPITGEPVRFAFSTIQRWLYIAARGTDPVGALRRKERTDAGHQHSMTAALRRALPTSTTATNPGALRFTETMVALAESRRELQPIPSYSTVRRFFRAHGIEKERRLTSRQTAGARRAVARLADREVRGYEADFVGQLFHWDGHLRPAPDSAALRRAFTRAVRRIQRKTDGTVAASALAGSRSPAGTDI